MRKPVLPPLNALRSFEAAARHLSFTAAARELSVTQAAVSHQVKALEDFLSCKLFERRTRALALTHDGRALLPVASAAFESLEGAVQRIRSGEVRRGLTVSLLPSFAARWLVPRLGRFRRAAPHIELHVKPSTELVDLARDEADVAIRFGRGRYPGLAVEHLLDDELFPVCRPGMLRGRRPRDLLRHVLLYDDDAHTDWPHWLEAAGVIAKHEPRAMVFSDASMMLQAAVDGLGVALARRVLVAAELRAKRLVRPFELSIPAGSSYYFVCLPARAQEPKIRAFRDWLRAEIARERRAT
ncbi:MAG TPA: transcriptional regulator GcvA [Polyangiales bacterium]|nr:transcriptional regulator GcvA [Polyangiales bacterium]